MKHNYENELKIQAEFFTNQLAEQAAQFQLQQEALMNSFNTELGQKSLEIETLKQ